MFNSENATKNIPVTVKQVDGTMLQGNMVIGLTSDLPRTLNGDVKFLEFEDMSGERCFFAKTALAQITPTDIPKVKKLDSGTDSDEDFNPYRVLKIAPGSDAATVQAAYYKRAKLYHPDRFSAAQLPDEMARYAENMARLINAAFKVLSNQPDQTGANGQTNNATPVQEPVVNR